MTRTARSWPAALLFVAISLAWSAITVLTGGFIFRTSIGTISLTDPIRPLLAGVLVGMGYVALRRRDWKSDVAQIGRWRVGLIIAGLCTFVAFLYATDRGTFFGAGPDQSGYVSQADGWVRGQLTWMPPEWGRHAGWHNGLWSSAPVGYRPTRDGVVAPTVSPGYPLLMALFQLIGGRDAGFYVVPVLGAALIWTTYLLGVALSGEGAGAIAAVLMLCSAAFVFWLSQPMSDIPVATMWTLAVLLAMRRRTRDAAGSGIATAVAVLIRANTAPLAIVPALLLVVDHPHRLRRLTVFVLATLPSVALIAALNTRWWGSPLTSGYGENDTLFAAGHIVPNLRRYLGWLAETQSPMIFVGLIAPLVARDAPERRRLILVTVVLPLLLLALYLPYLEFEYWAFLRFLLPAFPALLAGLGTVVAGLARRVWDGRAAVAMMAVATVALATLECRFTTNIRATRENNLHNPYARAVEVANALPGNAVLVSAAFSGTLHFYTGRDVLRYDVVWGNEMDGALEFLRSQGRPIYFIGHTAEVDAFKSQFSGSRAAVAIDSGRLQTFDDYAIADLSR